jgi:molybdate transport system substrate-binding protein
MNVIGKVKVGVRRSAIALGFAIATGAASRAAVVRVSAASSLRESMQEIGSVFEAAHPGDTVEFNFAGSQVLRTQIERGARVDVFAGADKKHMDALRAKKRVEPPAVFAHNALEVVTPKDAAKVRRLSDIARPGIRLVLAGDAVPAGNYANLAIAAMSRSGKYGRDFRRRVTNNIVSRESNVRMALSKITLGEADAAIVYVTDAATVSTRVNAIAIPKPFSPLVSYPIAVVAGTRELKLAREFTRLVRSAAGKRILARYGFRP